MKKRKKHVWKFDSIFRCLGLPLVSNGFFKVCLRNNRVFVICSNIRPHHHKHWVLTLFFWNRATTTIRQCHTVYIDTGLRLFCVSIHVANIRSDTIHTQTNGLTDLFIKPWYLFRKFCYNWNAWEIM